MFAGKKSAQIREILISESAWEEMTCLFAPSLDIKGKIITTDAMGCQKDIAEKIQKQGGDYLFAVKGNQGRLNKAFEEKFPLKELNNPKHDSYAMSEKSHGREETRLHIVCDVPDELIDFTFE